MAEKKLWEVMADAAIASEVEHPIDLERRMASAAMLRALADEVAPESEVPSDHEISTYGHHIAWVRWAAMCSFRQRLLNGAAEAEGKADG